MLTSVGFIEIPVEDEMLFRQQCCVAVPGFRVVRRAVDAAKAALPTWRTKTAKDRSQINEGFISTEVAPFAPSGIGREGSNYGLEDYLEVKYLMGGI